MHNASYSPWPTSRNVLKGLKTNVNGFIIVLEEGYFSKEKTALRKYEKRRE
ncbi:hypothetical protein lptwr_02057 [Legionella pneumophila]|uniref:hypothetical protein n=1 Tax=Legionella pneumophila TaxID=446 RepID=UPI0005C43272|nr:hypothetical protein [Legionella pneumophila]GAN24157.1 hypothetical protein lptwr_02057 [Legionella pneumophila]HDS3850259.1 hypothetical protein [Legionella pneumophila]